jgi:hypothetical protein
VSQATHRHTIEFYNDELSAGLEHPVKLTQDKQPVMYVGEQAGNNNRIETGVTERHRVHIPKVKGNVLQAVATRLSYCHVNHPQ